MVRNFLVTLGFVILLNACRPGNIDMNQEVEAAADTNISLMALGDSYTVGQSVADADRWTDQLTDSLLSPGPNLETSILARTGWTSADLLIAMDSYSFDIDYDFLSLLIGVNNQFRGIQISEFEIDLNELLDRAIALASHDPERVLVLSIPDWGQTPFGAAYNVSEIAQEIDQYNEVIEQMSAVKGLTFIDITAISRMAAAQTNLIAVDGLHPSGEMYALWAAEIEPYIIQLISPNP
jgi:lysophospholipase L1-like esterase